MEWKNKTNNVVFLFDKDAKFLRLDRHDFTMTNDIKDAISSGYFSDYHCYRPMSMYADINNQIYNLLPN